MTKLTTPRLDLVAASLELIRAELESPIQLAVELGALVPDGWPRGQYDVAATQYFKDRLTESPQNAGWY